MNAISLFLSTAQVALTFTLVLFSTSHVFSLFIAPSPIPQYFYFFNAFECAYSIRFLHLDAAAVPMCLHLLEPGAFIYNILLLPATLIAFIFLSVAGWTGQQLFVYNFHLPPTEPLASPSAPLPQAARAESDTVDKGGQRVARRGVGVDPLPAYPLLATPQNS